MSEVERAGAYELLIVEDDPGDAFLVQELLAEADVEFRSAWAPTLAEARPLLSRETQCVLLDLGLPDASGLDALLEILRAAPHAAVVVLTGLADRTRGLEAMALGAQDYLVKGEVDGLLLARSIRYAVERRRAEDTTRQLYESHVQREYNSRLERGLLPRPLLRDEQLSWAVRYRPGGGTAVLGGDFVDAIEVADGSLRVVIGDVAGHGPDEAALGVSLRIAWRTLVLAGQPDDEMLPQLDRILCSERSTDEVFATMCHMLVAPDRRSGKLWLAGHPPPLCVEPDPKPVSAEHTGPPLGVVADARWFFDDVELDPGWRLLLYTDGLIEGRAGAGSDRLGTEGLVEIVRAAWQADHELGEFGDDLVRRAQALHGGPLPDDVALLLLAHRCDRL